VAGASANCSTDHKHQILQEWMHIKKNVKNISSMMVLPCEVSEKCVLVMHEGVLLFYVVKKRVLWS